jgi:hypothetical protein
MLLEFELQAELVRIIPAQWFPAQASHSPELEALPDKTRMGTCCTSSHPTSVLHTCAMVSRIVHNKLFKFAILVPSVEHHRGVVHQLVLVPSKGGDFQLDRG